MDVHIYFAPFGECLIKHTDAEEIKKEEINDTTSSFKILLLLFTISVNLCREMSACRQKDVFIV